MNVFRSALPNTSCRTGCTMYCNTDILFPFFFFFFTVHCWHCAKTNLYDQIIFGTVWHTQINFFLSWWHLSFCRFNVLNPFPSDNPIVETFSKFKFIWISCLILNPFNIREKVKICERKDDRKYAKCRWRKYRKIHRQKIHQNVNNSVKSWRRWTCTELENYPPACLVG